jgi:hypothetical protein
MVEFTSVAALGVSGDRVQSPLNGGPASRGQRLRLPTRTGKNTPLGRVSKPYAFGTRNQVVATRLVAGTRLLVKLHNDSIL